MEPRKITIMREIKALQDELREIESRDGDGWKTSDCGDLDLGSMADRISRHAKENKIKAMTLMTDDCTIDVRLLRPI